jgi:hypothetical protein
MPRSPEDYAAVAEKKRQRQPQDRFLGLYAAEGQKIAAQLELPPGSPAAVDAAMRYACEKRGRSVWAVRAERDRVLKSSRSRP